MKTTEIAEAVIQLSEADFDAAEFPFEFLKAFGANETTVRRLKADGKGSLNKSDIPGGVLLGGKTRLKSHVIGAEPGGVEAAMKALQESVATEKNKATMLVASDGEELQAIDQASGDVLACTYAELPQKFGFFFHWLGISAVKEIKENPIDVHATGRLDKLYVELLKDERNKDWANEPGRARFNHFMAQLIFSFYAEDTSIFYCPGVGTLGERPKNWAGLFTETVRERTKSDGTDTRDVISEIFRAMNIDTRDGKRNGANLPGYADFFPYVNGGLFGGEVQVPHFTRMARTYLIRAGELKWTDINPDIFGSMIQAVADDEERGSLGMHYTSVPNILKVLNPLFLDDLEAQLERAKTNKQQLGKLKKRLAGIRVFDPACGSGNFLVIAYKKMRDIEHRANLAGGWGATRSVIPISNFRGIEIKHFAAEVARLALVIAEYQCDAIYLDQKQADALFLPLDQENWIVQGNALRLDWLGVCPAPGEATVKLTTGDLLDEPLTQTAINFENEGGEVFICGNPPYLGSKWQSVEQKADLEAILAPRCDGWRSLDYVSGWFVKAADYLSRHDGVAAFVSTNSICQGQQVPVLWSAIFETGNQIVFAYTSFIWSNLAAYNAGVTTVIVGISCRRSEARWLFDEGSQQKVSSITPYLFPGLSILVEPENKSLSGLPEMARGNSPTDGGNLLLEANQLDSLGLSDGARTEFIRPFIGSRELINGLARYCIWIDDDRVEEANHHPAVAKRIDAVRDFRKDSKKAATVRAANWPHRFDERKPLPLQPILVIPVISSENRPYLPIGLCPAGTVVSNKVFFMDSGTLWPLALISSTLNLAWVGAVCARMRTDFSYTNTLGWNTFPVPKLSNEDKAELTRSAENILLAREQYFPATIADMYDPKRMDEEFPAVRAAHEANDELLENIYIGRRFRNDTERLEKLFEMYVEMTGKGKAV